MQILHFGTVDKLYQCLLYHNSEENFITKCKQECNVHYIEHKTRDTVWRKFLMGKILTNGHLENIDKKI